MKSQSAGNDPVSLGVLAGVFLMIATSGAHWFITPEAWSGPAWQRVATGVQILIGLGVAFWSYRRARRILETARPATDRSGA